MGRYNFVSPGAAAGDALTEVLARQREEARRALLDEVTRANAESQRKATAERIASEQQERELSRLGAAEAGLEAGEDISTRFDPDTVSLFKKYGRVSPSARKPTPSVSVSEEFNDPDFVGPTQTADPTWVPPVKAEAPKPDMGQYFVGSQKQRDLEKHQAKAAEIFGQLQNPKLTPSERLGLIMQAEAAGINVDSGAYTSAFRTPPKRGIYDPTTRKWIEAPEGVSDVTVIPREPRAPQPPAKQMYVDNDGKAWLVDMRTGKKIEAGIENPRRPGSGTGNGKDAILPQTITNQLNVLKGKATPKGGMFASSEGDPQAWAAYSQGVDSIIAQAYQRKIISADVADTIRHVIKQTGIVEDRKNKIYPDLRSTSEIIDELKDSFDTPEEAIQFAQFLPLVRGQ